MSDVQLYLNNKIHDIRYKNEKILFKYAQNLEFELLLLRSS